MLQAIGLLEGVKETVELRTVDADSGVTDAEYQLVLRS